MSLITDLVTKFKSERPEAKLGQQLYAIPQRENDMVAGQAFYYYVGDRRRTAVDFNHQICFHLNWLKFKKVTPKQYKRLQDSMTPMEDLISHEYIQPFLLFVNGLMIPWEYISIVITQERYDLLIDGYDQTYFDTYLKGAVQSVYVIMLPDSIEYKEGLFNISDKTMFAFDEDGKLVKSGSAHIVIDNNGSGVGITTIDPTEGPIFFFSEDNKYSYFAENVFVFNNNLYQGNDNTRVLSTAAKINDGNFGAGDDFHVRIFFNKGMATPSYENISHVELSAIKDDVTQALRNPDTAPEYIKHLSEHFDVSMDRNLDYETNRSNSLDKIAKYNPLFFNEYYNTQVNFSVIEVDYAWVQSHLDGDGFLHIGRRFNSGNNYYIVVLVNGEIYQYYRNHKYEADSFLCPVTGMKEGDIIELWYFKNADNFVLTGKVDIDEPYLPLDTDKYYIDGNLRIFCKESPNPEFNFPVDGMQHFPVDFELDYDEDVKKFRVRFENSFYYGKKLYFTSINRFAYAGYEVQPEDGEDDIKFYQIDLGSQFMYCNEYDRYLVFFNGRRMTNDQYRLVIPCRPTTPFISFHIYMTIAMVPGDRIDIFYLPHHFNDIYSLDDLPATGLIEVPKSDLPFVLDNHLFTFWINGKKIPASDIKNFDSNRVQIINDQHSIKNFRVTTMITDKDEYNELKDRFETYESIWDKVIATNPNPYKLLGIDPSALTNTESDFYDSAVYTNIIMRELLRDRYLGDAVADTTGPFVYDYLDVDQSAIVGEDPAGNLLLDVCDSNLENNLDVERPTP